MGKPIDLTGQVFGRTTAVEMAHRDRFKNCVWRCLCSCGLEHFATAASLRKGQTKSCNCLRREMFRSNRNNVGATGVPCPFSRDRLEEIYKNGTPIFLIAEQAGVGRGVVRRWMREAAIDFRAVSQIRKLAAFRNRQSVLARIRHAQRIASQMIREGSIERHWLFTRSVCVKRQKGLIKYHAFRRAKQQAEREQSEAIERSLNGDTFK